MRAQAGVLQASALCLEVRDRYERCRLQYACFLLLWVDGTQVLAGRARGPVVRDDPVGFRGWLPDLALWAPSWPRVTASLARVQTVEGAALKPNRNLVASGSRSVHFEHSC